jgi:hypothetical protein
MFGFFGQPLKCSVILIGRVSKVPLIDNLLRLILGRLLSYLEVTDLVIGLSKKSTQVYFATPSATKKNIL